MANYPTGNDGSNSATVLWAGDGAQGVDVPISALGRARIRGSSVAIADADYAVAANVNRVAFSSQTVTRTVTLPAANSVPAGYELIVGDAIGACTASINIICARAGADTISGATSETIAAAYGMRRFISDGVSRWSFDKGVLRASSNLSDVANADTALTNLGGTTVGRNVFKSASRIAAALLIGAAGASATEARSADFTVDTAKPGAYYDVTAGASGVTVTLPSAATAGDGFVVGIDKIDASAGDVNITGGLRLSCQDEVIWLRSDGSVWEIMHRYDPLAIDWQSGAFGTYGDGDVTINSGTTTLVRDMHYRRLTVSGAATTINPAGFVVFADVIDISGVSGSSVWGATLSVGGNASGTNGATAGTSTALSTAARSLHTGINGNSGATGVTGVGAQAGTLTAASWLSGSSSQGGAGGSGGSGAGGTARAQSASNITKYWRLTHPFIGLSSNNAVAAAAGAPGASGSSGAGDGTNAGGGGGGSGKGGMMMWVACRKLVTGASVPAGFGLAKGSNGGNGGSPTTGNCGGGGGGGGGAGGYVVAIIGEVVGAGSGFPVDVTGGNGGNGGTGVGTGAAGGGGYGGCSGYAVRCNAKTGVWTDYGTPGNTNQVANSGATGGVATTAQYTL